MTAKWPTHQTANLRRLWRAKLTAREIGELLGVTRNAVIGKLNRLGLQITTAERSRRITEANLKMWADPDARKRQSIRMREWWVRHKADAD